MISSPEPLEILWENILTRDARRIRAAFAQLDSNVQKVIFEHLTKMSSEPDWHPEQRASARAALDALSDKGIKT